LKHYTDGTAFRSELRKFLVKNAFLLNWWVFI
jgi:hypothetical protein